MSDLARLQILIVDCQATGAGPANGHLLEMGWGMVRACDAPGDFVIPIRTFVTRLPQGETIPPRVQKITGLCETDIRRAENPEAVWQRLVRFLDSRRPLPDSRLPTAIHYARYEKPFLSALHQEITPKMPFPFSIVCTHHIARRLLPDLPRLGIRALAGYLGHSVPEQRRCAHHVTATAVVWHHLCRRLNREYGVATWPDLVQWLHQDTGTCRRKRVYPMPAEKRKGVPDRPGIYQMMRSNGDVLYVGKATSLKKRVGSYFHRGRRHAEHLLEMLSQAMDLKVTVTGSALEAAVLESDRIKHLSPPYNIALRSRDRFPGFAVRDYTSLSERPDAVHTVGPLPGVVPIHPFSAIVRLCLAKPGLSAEEIETLCRASLNLSPAYAPEPACFMEGFRLFYRRNDTLHQDPCPSKLLRLGARLWRKRLEEKEAKAASEDVDEEKNEEKTEKDSPFTWSVEAVARALESSVRQSARMVRRARFFCLLCESSLAWELRGRESNGIRYLVIHKGDIRQNGTIPKSKALPIPPGGKTGMRSRLYCFDLATYDRMRVITTELRRLLSEGRDVRVRLMEPICIGPRKLSIMLRWI